VDHDTFKGLQERHPEFSEAAWWRGLASTKVRASTLRFSAFVGQHIVTQPFPDRNSPGRQFPVSAGIFFGLGLGGFFDGIVLHQVLQWHHMLSSWYPVNTIANLEFNTRWDGIFHSATYIFVLIGLFLLWRTAHRRYLYWSSKLLIGTMLLGFGLFNTVEGIVNHHLLGIHHVNEIAAREHWVIWDEGFTLWGAAMIVIGWVLMRTGQRETQQ
jgi:uncharacterized membrane protein